MSTSLCETCRHLRLVVSGTGSRFLLCQKALADRRFPKYPPQPLRQCRGYEPLTAVDEAAREADGGQPHSPVD